MAITRYDRPAESNIVNTVTPIPFEQMMQAGQMMANQYDQGMDALQKVYDDTYNIKYIPGSKDEQYVKQQVIPAAREVFEKYISQDMGNPLVRRQAIMDLNSKIDKQRINKIQESWTGWADNQKWRQKLQAEGKYADYLDTPDSGYDTDMMGVYNKLTPAKVDYRQEAEQVFNNLEPDSYIKGNEVMYTINQKKLQNTARGAVQSFLESVAGQQKLQEYRRRTKDYDTHPEDIAYNYLMEVGKEKLMNRHAGFLPEYMFKDNTKTPTSEYFKVERTPVVSIQNRKLKSTDFAEKLRTAIDRDIKGVTTTQYGFAVPQYGADKGVSDYGYDTSLLNNKEVKNLVSIMPEEYKKQYDQLTKSNLKNDNPEEYKQKIGDFYSKLQNTYKQIEQDLQQGSYLNAYYPDQVNGIPESRLNNVETQTKYVFGTNKLKELGSGQLSNREFIDPNTGKVYSGKDFYDEVVKEELDDNEEAKITTNGKYHYENPFVAMTNNSNFSNAYQITVNGKQYIMSGSAGDYTDPLYRHAAAANQSYSKVKYNPGIAIDEGDGTIKLYQDGVYSIADKSNNQIIGRSESFEKAYNDARQNLISKYKR